MRTSLRRHALPVLGLVGLGIVLLHRATGRFFWNGDDAFELPMAHLLASGEWAAWWDASSLSGHTGLRVVPRLLWGLDSLLHGGSAAGYYATNIALHIACMVAVYALCARWTGSRLGGIAGGIVFGFLGPTIQVVSFLSAREDAVSTLAFVIAVGLWPAAKDSRRAQAAVVALYAVICLSKLSGVTLPGVLLALDLATMPPQQALAPRRLLRRYGPLAAVLLVMVAAWAGLIGLQGAGSYAALRGGGGDPTGVLAANLYQGLLHPLADHPARHWRPVDRALVGAQAALLPLCLILGAWRGRRAVVAGGLAWIALGLLPPAALLGWNPEQSWGDGRYFHLASAGLALLVAGAVAPMGRRDGGGTTWWRRGAATVGLLTAAVTGVAFARLVEPQFALQGQHTRHLARATEEAARSLGPGGRLVLAWPRADQGVRRILDGGFLRVVAPSLPARFYVLPEGTETLLSVAPGEDPRLDDVMIVHTGFRLDALEPGRDALVAQGVRAHPIFDRGRRFTPVDLPVLAPSSDPEGAAIRFDFRGGDAGWRLGPGMSGPEAFDLADPNAGEAPPRVPEGLAWTGSGDLDWPGNPEPPATLYLPELVSPPLPLDPERVCGLSLGLTVLARPAPAGRRALEPWNFGVFTWATRARGPYFGGALAFPVRAGTQRVDLDLGNSPSWRRSRGVYRLGLTPSARAAEVRVESVELRWCGP